MKLRMKKYYDQLVRLECWLYNCLDMVRTYHCRTTFSVPFVNTDLVMNVNRFLVSGELI